MTYVPALHCQHVRKQYGNLTALDDIELEVKSGEIFALLGPNGAGKSTLIHCISGVAKQTSGNISVFGHDTLREFRITRRQVGLVPQEVTFDPFFTPMQSLMIQMGLMGVEPDPARAEEVLKTFSLWDKRDAYARALSGGMKRRLLIAKAFVHRPKLVFLDEPTAGVDVELRRDLWREVRKQREEGATIVLTTHYIEEAEQLADRVGVIHRGKLVLVRNREELLQQHAGKSLEDIFVELVHEAEGEAA